MAISRVELQGQFTRAQDFTTIKQNEDNKGMVDQSNFQKHMERTVDDKLHQVRKGDDAENRGQKFDAKEKGKNSYAGDGGKRRNKQEKDRDDKVILKTQGGFDMKI